MNAFSSYPEFVNNEIETLKITRFKVGLTGLNLNFDFRTNPIQILCSNVPSIPVLI